MLSGSSGVPIWLGKIRPWSCHASPIAMRSSASRARWLPQQVDKLRGQKQRPSRAGRLELTDNETGVACGRRAILNPLHAVSDLQRRRVPIQCVAAMEGGLGVWLQTASGIVPIGPARFGARLY